MNLLGYVLVGAIVGVAFFPASFGMTLAQVYKGFKEEMDKDNG